MRIIYSFVLLLFCAASIYSQDLSCADFKTGTFHIDNPDGSRVVILRDNHQQIEKSVGTAIVWSGNLTWIDSCTYTIIYTKSSDQMMGKTIRVHIERIEGNKAYCLVTSEDFPEASVRLEMTKPD